MVFAEHYNSTNGSRLNFQTKIISVRQSRAEQSRAEQSRASNAGQIWNLHQTAAVLSNYIQMLYDVLVFTKVVVFTTVVTEGEQAGKCLRDHFITPRRFYALYNILKRAISSILK